MRILKLSRIRPQNIHAIGMGQEIERHDVA